MKNFTRAAMMISLCVFVFQANAQLVGNEAVKANFGIDADVDADTLKFGTYTVPAEGTDDWFDRDLRNTGEGVIDTNGAAALKDFIDGASMAQRNFRFEKRMAYPINTVVSGKRWLDAVYGRDNFSAASENDSSVFVGTSDKNFFHPKEWSFGIGGTPQKNDIIDVYAHIRRDGTSFTDSLWGFGAASTISQGGSNHVDFEFFRAFLQLGLNSQLMGLDVDSGHTAWKFNANGSVQKPGDIIFSFDFENGGTNPVVSIRVWLDPATIPGGSYAAFNALAGRPFNFTTVFNTEASGTFPSAPFGYAEITTRGGGTHAFARTSRTNEGETRATPWGTLINPGAVYTDNYAELSLSEFGINLTAFGLDQAINFGDPCIQVFGSLGVKTRSSTSFTAELKDFSGPYVFGRRLEAVFAIEGDTLSCTNLTATTKLTGMNPPPANTTIIWSGAGLIAGQSTPDATWNLPGWKYANVTINGTLCANTDSFFVPSIVSTPEVSIAPADELTCTTTEVTLTATTNVQNPTFAWSGGGTGNTKDVSDPGPYSVTVTDPVNGCSASATVTVSEDVDGPGVTIDPADELTCTTTQITLTAHSVPGATFQWSGGGTGATKNVTDDGNYSVTATDPDNGCTSSATVSVSEDVTPPGVTIDPADELTCTTTQITLTAHSIPGATFQWSGGGTGSTKNVTDDGIYRVTATDPDNGCTSTASVTVTQDNTPPGVTIDPPATLTCLTTTVTLTAHSIPGATFEWSNGGTGSTEVVGDPGPYSVTATDPDNGCTSSASVTVNENVTPPNVGHVPDATISCTNGSATLTGSSNTPNAQFQWTRNGTIVSNTAVAIATQAGTYILRVTNPANSCVARDTAVVTLINDQPQCSLQGPPMLPIAGSTGNTLTGVFQNAFTITWSLTSDDGNWLITGGQGTSTIEYTAGSGGSKGTFKVVLENQAGTCKDSCTVEFYAATGGYHCTLTQGAYGNSNGKFCKIRRTELLRYLTVTPLTVGVLRTRSLTFDSSDASCILLRLPSGGTPSQLPPMGNNGLPADMEFVPVSCATTPFNIPTWRDRFRNVFLGQTITLGLNLRLGTGLDTVHLLGEYIITGGGTGGDGCGDTSHLVSNGTTQIHHIPQDVLDYLGANNTVLDLFNLANLSLAGLAPNQPTRSEINEAISTINEAFDECAALIGFTNEGPPRAKTDDSDLYSDEMDEENLRAAVNVLPNPFGNSTNVQYMLAETKSLKVEVVDVTGRLVKVLFNGVAEENTVYSTQFDSGTLANGMYIIRLSTDDLSVQKRIILQR